MVFTANAGVVVGQRGMSARFRAPFRNPETAVYHKWLASIGLDMRAPNEISEGEGDFAPAPDGKLVFAGDGVRTAAAAHEEMAAHLGVPIVPLTLVDERFYHLDTALSILDENTALYYPSAFSGDSREVLAGHFADLIAVDDSDALVLGANAVSDGLNVLLEAEARSLASVLADRGFRPVPLEMSEFRKSGGAVRCCVLEMYPAEGVFSNTVRSRETHSRL
jgi:arginine dihydrolase